MIQNQISVPLIVDGSLLCIIMAATRMKQIDLKNFKGRFARVIENHLCPKTIPKPHYAKDYGFISASAGNVNINILYNVT